MTETLRLCATGHDDDRINFWAKGNGFALATKTEDLLEGMRVRGEAPEEIQFFPEASFIGCKGSCRQHLSIDFADDGTVRIAYDDGLFAARVFKHLYAMADDHELLMCACGCCEHGRKDPDDPDSP
jgi:hypothetical protein